MSNFLCFSGLNFLIACSTSDKERVCVDILYPPLNKYSANAIFAHGNNIQQKEKIVKEASFIIKQMKRIGTVPILLLSPFTKGGWGDFLRGRSPKDRRGCVLKNE